MSYKSQKDLKADLNSTQKKAFTNRYVRSYAELTDEQIYFISQYLLLSEENKIKIRLFAKELLENQSE